MQEQIKIQMQIQIQIHLAGVMEPLLPASLQEPAAPSGISTIFIISFVYPIQFSLSQNFILSLQHIFTQPYYEPSPVSLNPITIQPNFHPAPFLCKPLSS